MYIDRNKWPSQNGKTYESIYLRESYREGSKVKKRTIANLTHCRPDEIAAIELALKNKNDLSALGSTNDVQLLQGPRIGAAFVLYQTAKRLGIEKALGTDRHGKLAMWQVIARVLFQGSRLSAVRSAKRYGAAETLGLTRGFDEDDLYDNLGWLAENQEKIENRLFSFRRGKSKPGLFLYDVTSSYLEGDQNELADWGYNRDKKRGKKQIVIGLLCDEDGSPVSTEVFTGNTSDLCTFESQVKKAVKRFGCDRVTMVGDRGMIKSGQVSELEKAGFHYITAITKAQIRSLIKKDVFQLGLFDENLCEALHGGVRYILRRNPIRAEEMAQNRAERLAALQRLAVDRNTYLAEHKRADATRARRLVIDKCAKLGLESFVTVRAEERRIIVEVDEEYLKKISELDGCYALKTDLPAEAANAETIHTRYKDLALVEQGFRTMKTDHLKVRPIFVRTESNTRGHVLVVMLAYLIARELRQVWAGLDLRVGEGLDILKGLSAVEMKIKGCGSCLRMPRPDREIERLLKALKVKMPPVWPKINANVDTRKKLTSQRKQP
jgi:hypothetical protein